MEDLKIRVRRGVGGDELFCLIRKRFIVATPEEFVRQKTIIELVRLGYSPLQIGIEIGFTIAGGKQLRADLVVYDSSAKPLILVECKARDIVITQEVFRQASKYNAHFRARYILLTNSAQSLLFETTDFVDYCRVEFQFIIHNFRSTAVET
ncbi:MAG: type I restriction enzyme HsdR N-terminal domain-containing protein [Rikenellaceae bacterium]